MSRLKELIERLCPDGVPFVKLGDYINIYTGDQFNKRDMSTSGSYPVVNGGINPSGFIESYNEPRDTISISQGGASAGYVAWQDTPFWAGAHCYVIRPDSKLIINRFLYFFLKNKESYLQQMQHGAGIPALNRDKIKELKFPLVPIEVQEEIVRILDTFCAYAAELQAELQARKEQYEYYRNLLLTFNPSACGCGTDGEQEIKVTTCGGGNYKVIWKAMGEICDLSRGKVYSKDYLRNNSGSYPVYSSQTVNNGELGRISTYDIEGEYLSWTTDGAYAGSIFYRSGKFSITNVCGLIKPSKIIDIHFLHHWLTLQAPKHVYQGMGNPKLMSNQMSEIRVPILPIEHQKKIASILDRFEALVNDLTQGLPAEIAAVRERYEYYRNKLLTFKRIA